MKTRAILLFMAVLLAVGFSVSPRQATAQLEDSVVNHPEVFLPRERMDEDVISSVRRARLAEARAVQLEREGRTEDAMDFWREAFSRYELLRRDHLRPDIGLNQEPLVPVDWKSDWGPDPKAGDNVMSEAWVPLADYINGRFSWLDWPRSLRDRMISRQSAPGAEMLRTALREHDEALLRRCARFYQFSPAGRAALRILADVALERGDAVLAVRWLEDLKLAWPEHFERDMSLQLTYLRACRHAGMEYRVGRRLRMIERLGLTGKVDVGGVQRDSAELIAEIVSGVAPAERNELRRPGWLTVQGRGDRNGVAPPISSIGEMVNLSGDDEKTDGLQIGRHISAVDQPGGPHHGRPRRTGPVPMVFPTVHESGVFVHRVDESPDSHDQLLWLRHGRESGPLPLEVPRALRYVRPQGMPHPFFPQGADSRRQFRVLGSTVGTVRWDLDGRESDLLFAVMGDSTPSGGERGQEPTGNQIQGWNLTDDASLRVTLPNRRVESEDEYAFLRHVTFRGAPLIRDNRLYIAGAIPDRNSYEVWLFCFDITPKGDPSEGEGKLIWRVHLGSRSLESASRFFGGGRIPVTVPDVSSVGGDGGLLFVSSHGGFSAAVERVSGELAWVSRYARVNLTHEEWFTNPPVVAGGLVVTAPNDHNISLILDAVRGTHWMEFPIMGKGPRGEYEYVLGVTDNRLLVQGRARLYAVALTTHRRGGTHQADFGETIYQSGEFQSPPTGRGIIAGGRVLVPLEGAIAMYELGTGKLVSTTRLEGVQSDRLPATLTVYCRGPAYEDEDGVTRYRAAVVVDPDTGTAYNVEHLRNGDRFTFPSGRQATVEKETFLVYATARWMYVFRAND